MPTNSDDDRNFQPLPARGPLTMDPAPTDSSRFPGAPSADALVPEDFPVTEDGEFEEPILSGDLDKNYTAIWVGGTGLFLGIIILIMLLSAVFKAS